MKLNEIRKQIKEDGAETSVNLLRFFDVIQKSPKFSAITATIRRPTDKYKAIVKFAGMLGIPEEKLTSFINNQSNITSREQQ